jgi:hypothetical protein
VILLSQIFEVQASSQFGPKYEVGHYYTENDSTSKEACTNVSSLKDEEVD